MNLFDFANQANFELHGYFSAEKFLVLTPSRSQGNSKFLALLHNQNQTTQIFAPADAHSKAAGHLKGVGALKFAWFGLKKL